jgi:Asp-tRNA(Asn)/Glu-tRNA(Gln) amidotransferase A subunit family amidase
MKHRSRVQTGSGQTQGKLTETTMRFAGAPLRIGYYTGAEDGYCYPSPCPAVSRAMDETIRNLEARGHTLVPFAPNDETIAPYARMNAVVHGEMSRFLCVLLLACPSVWPECPCSH